MGRVVFLTVLSLFTPSSNLIIKFTFEHVQKGIGLGSNINDNYYFRDKKKT